MRPVKLQIPTSQIKVSRWRRFRAGIDWPLVITIAIICILGLVNLYSATHGTPHHTKYDQQLRWMVAGAVVFAIMTFIDYRAILRFAWIGLGATIVMLAALRLMGGAATAKGSARWLNLGGFGVQPSEFAKLFVILAMARMAQDAEVRRPSRREVGILCVFLAIPVGMIALQPDLGTSILLTLIILSTGFLVVQNVWPIAQVTLAGLLMVPILWETMHKYQKDRVLAFLDPSSDLTGTGWHTQQSIFAVGSGRIWGRGWGHGTQNKYGFLPEHWTDFPYSVWAEEWGFVGCVVLLAMFAFLLIWVVNVALTARDKAGAVICVGVAAMTFWHVMVNIAMVLGVAPVVGVTLPFISYGGSSLLTFFAAMGLVANVSLRKHGY